MILFAWVVCLVWTVATSALMGYGESAATGTILGIPEWVFVGVALPWAGATVFSVWFAWRRIAEDPLDDVGERPTGSAERDTGST